MAGAAGRYYPYAESKGVYIFFDSRKQGVYVGKSESNAGIGERIGKHVRGAWWLDAHRATYVVSIPFDQAPHLAPEFESHLLDKYRFPGAKR